MTTTQIQYLINENSKGLPEDILQEILDFIQFLKFKKNGKVDGSVNTNGVQANSEGEIKREFEKYKEIWKRETRFSSNTTEMINHPAYLKIMALGKNVIPFLLRDMEQTGNHWFEALNQITTADPILKGHEGKIRLMINDWIAWAKNNNIDF